MLIIISINNNKIINLNASATLLQKLTANNATEDFSFGVSVSIYENIAVVGSTGCIIEEQDNAGCVYIFEYNNITNNFTQIQRLHARTVDRLDYFGYSLSFFNNNIIVGSINYEY